MKISKLQSLLHEGEAFLITDEVSRKYLTSFSSSDGYLLIKKDGACFFVDARYFEDAEKKISNCRVELCDGFDKLKDELNTINNIIVESSRVTLKRFDRFKEIFSSASVSYNDELDRAIENMRSKKNEEEIRCLKKAQNIAEIAFEETLGFLKAGVTENQVAAFLEYSMRKNGGEKQSFDTIIVSGKKSSVPHGVPGDKTIEKGDFVTMDFGTVFGGYHSDMTRTVVVGKASERQKTVYYSVLEAQQKAIEFIRAGVKCSDVDGVARQLLNEKGFGKYFTHSLGHGVGLEIHEAPSVNEKNDSILECGNVITVEPGIYIPDEFGVRIEDFGLVSENGFENFTEARKNLIEIIS